MVRKRKRKIEILRYEPSSEAERKLCEELDEAKKYYRMLDLYRPPEFDEEM